MHNKLLTGIFSAIGVFVLLIVSCIFIKFDFSQICSFISSDGSYSIIVNTKIHNYIKKNNIKKIMTEINERVWTFNIYFKTNISSEYSYWTNPTLDSFNLSDGNYTFSFDFGKINFLSYLF